MQDQHHLLAGGVEKLATEWISNNQDWSSSTTRGGVDRCDQNISLYRIAIKTRKWWWLLFIWIPDMIMQNCWIFYRTTLFGLFYSLLQISCTCLHFYIASLKKPYLHMFDLKLYRPVSNLSFISKFLVLLRRLLTHCNDRQLLPEYQSAYRPQHSTETALICIVNQVLRSIDDGNVCALVLLDLSSAFDPLITSIYLM